MIETKVEGSPASVRTAATYLSGSLHTAVDEAAESAQRARQRAGRDWTGSASDAYRGFAAKLVSAGDEQTGLLTDAAEKFRAYAGQLERMQERMSGRRGEAAGGGLTVSGTTIVPPPDAVPPSDLPPGSSPAAADAWDRANRAFEEQKAKVELYNQLHDEVVADWQRLDDWIASHLEPMRSEASAPTEASEALGLLKEVPGGLVGLALETEERRLGRLAREYRERARQLRAQADDARAARRSGNPARRAAGEAADIPGDRRAARAADAAAEGAERISRRIPIIGGLLSGGLAARDIADGESPSSVLTGELGGVVGGVAGAGLVIGGAALLGVSAPVLVIAGGAVAGGIAVGMLAEWGYEELVPQDVREKIDDGLREFGSDVKDKAEETWDTITFWD